MRLVLRHDGAIGLLVDRERQQIPPGGDECIRLPKLRDPRWLYNRGIRWGACVRLSCRHSTRKSAQCSGYWQYHVATVSHYLPPKLFVDGISIQQCVRDVYVYYCWL
jgi:hypothetical protein